MSGEKRKKLIEQDPKSDEIIRPILRGRDIKRYGYNFADLWLINTHNGIKEKGIKPINVNNYPAIKKHLDNYWDKIEHRADQGDTPYNLRNCAYIEDFYRQKIVYGQFRQGEFALDENNYFLSSNEYFIVSKEVNLKILLALLNSKVCYFFCKTMMNTLGGATTIAQKDIFIKIPLPKKLDNFFEQKIENYLVNKEYEAIDKLIYELYKLNEEDIDCIKNS